MTKSKSTIKRKMSAERIRFWTNEMCDCADQIGRLNDLLTMFKTKHAILQMSIEAEKEGLKDL